MSQWPDHLPVRSVRIARHTNQFNAIVRFYRDVIGLPEIGRFGGHGGYDGIMLGLPGQDYHLEFTSHPDGPPAAPPSRDNLLVFYIDDVTGNRTSASVVVGDASATVAVSRKQPFLTDGSSTLKSC